MKKPDGIVAVVSRERLGKKEFLILHRVLNWAGWELLKGGSEENESLEETARREVFEEAGLKKILSIKKLPVISRFFDSVRKRKRAMHGFLIVVDPQEKVSLEKNVVVEHDSFEWENAETVLQKLTFNNQKKVFKAALEALEK